jgi:hypothetical protein
MLPSWIQTRRRELGRRRRSEDTDYSEVDDPLATTASKDEFLEGVTTLARSKKTGESEIELKTLPQFITVQEL